MDFTNDIFAEVRNLMNIHFERNLDLLNENKHLYRVDVSKKDIWDKYLEIDDGEIYKTNGWHDCSLCHQFLNKMGNVIGVLDDGEFFSIFSCYEIIPDEYEPYRKIFKELNDLVVNASIRDVFYASEEQIGIEATFQELKDENDEYFGVQRNDHFHMVIPQQYVSSFVKRKMDKHRTNRKMLEDSVNVISIEALEMVMDLIEDNNLYRGAEWKNVLDIFYKIKTNKPKSDDNNYWWIESNKIPPSANRLKNTSMGVLLLDLTNGMDLEDAIKKFEAIVAPTNYKRSKPIFTPQMLEEAKKKLEELGYLESIKRRYATIEDLSIKNVLFANRNLTVGIKDDDLFSELSKDAIINKQNFDYVQEINIDDFINEILPEATEVNLYLVNDLFNNLASLVAPVDEKAPTMFKWDNPYSWTFKNNIADSAMKERVKAMGGDVDVDLRFSIQWNDYDDWDQNDLDAHCTEPDGHEIYYSDKVSSKTGGWLDVDIINPDLLQIAVENIRYKNKYKMIPGEYLFRVHQFSYRGGNNGFKAEIEFNNHIYKFEYPLKVEQNEYIDVAKVILNEDREFFIEPLLDSKIQARKEWNLKANNFIPVSLICYSPNYWDNNHAGNKIVFFMLKDCINDTQPNGWYNEFLNEDLRDYRRVMEALSSKAKLKKTDNQLSGLGFSLTQKNKVTVEVISKRGKQKYNVVI